MENKIITTLFCRFIIGGIILSGSTFLANYGNPLFAGILVTIPLELVSLFFIKENKLYSYARSILIMSIATVIPVLYYNIVHPLKIMPLFFEIISSFCVWLLVGILLFYCLPDAIYYK